MGWGGVGCQRSVSRLWPSKLHWILVGLDDDALGLTASSHRHQLGLECPERLCRVC